MRFLLNEKKRILVLIFVACSLIQIITFLSLYDYTYPYDDAYISYRYAKNISEGKGWVYNAGEVTSGTTSFINTGLIAIIKLVTNYEADSIGRVLPLIFSLLTTLLLGIIIFKISNHLLLSLLVMMFYSFAAFIYKSIFSGMETNLFIFNILIIVYLLLNKKLVLASIFGGILPFIRPDGMLFSVLLILYFFIYIKKIEKINIAKPLSVIALLLFLYPIINLIFFDLLYPLSIHAKRITYNLGQNIYLQPRLTVLKSFLFPKLGIFLSPFFIIGVCYSIVNKMKELILLSLFTIGWILIYVFINPWMRPWYYYVTPPFILLLSICGIYFTIFKSKNIINEYIKIKYLKKIIIIWSIVMFIYLGNVLVKGVIGKFAMSISNEFNAKVIGIADYLSEKNNIRNKSIYVGDIGYIGYKTNSRIIDFVGLVYPKALDFSKYKIKYGHSVSINWEKQIEFLELENPDYIVCDNIYPFYLKMKENKYLKDNYDLIKKFGSMDIWEKSNKYNE